MTRFRGSALVEVLVAFAIFTVLMVPLLTLRTTNRRQAASANLQIQAQVWARQVVTVLASHPFGDLKLMQGRKQIEAPGLEPPSGFPGTLAIDISSADPGRVEPDLLRISVKVTWSVFGKGSAEGQASLTLDRLVAMPERSLVSEFRS